MTPKERVRERLILAGVLVEDRRQHQPRWMRWAIYVLAGYSALCVALFTFLGVGR